MILCKLNDLHNICGPSCAIMVTVQLNNSMNDCYFTNFSIYDKKEEKMLKNLNDRQNNIFLWAIRRVKNIYVIQAVKKLYISHLQSHKYLFPHFFFFNLQFYVSMGLSVLHRCVHVISILTFFICIHNLIQYIYMYGWYQ